jgi:predicted phosphoribosyltransferase
VDDGLATGSSMRAGVDALRRLSPARIVIAVPVAPRSTLPALAGLADEIVCLATPEPFHAVGMFYDDFGQVGDQEVRDALALREFSRQAF